MSDLRENEICDFDETDNADSDQAQPGVDKDEILYYNPFQWR